MEQVILLTETQKLEVEGKKFNKDSYFNPIQDEDSNWIISIEEQDQCINPDFDWIKQCPKIEYKPKPMPNPFEQE
jgi:hypothetical protein